MILTDQICKLTETIDQISLGNRKLASELVLTKIVNSRLDDRIINLEKSQVKWKQYSRRNNVELSGKLDCICVENLDNTVINICKESRIDVEAGDIG